jgi:hypothetical protein
MTVGTYKAGVEVRPLNSEFNKLNKKKLFKSFKIHLFY